MNNRPVTAELRGRCKAVTRTTASYRRPTVPDTAATEDRDEHEVAAFYDNATAAAVGDTYGWPTLDCSCGFQALAPSWEEAGTLYDEHISEVRNAA